MHNSFLWCSVKVLLLSIKASVILEKMFLKLSEQSFISLFNETFKENNEFTIKKNKKYITKLSGSLNVQIPFDEKKKWFSYPRLFHLLYKSSGNSYTILLKCLQNFSSLIDWVFFWKLTIRPAKTIAPHYDNRRGRRSWSNNIARFLKF